MKSEAHYLFNKKEILYATQSSIVTKWRCPYLHARVCTIFLCHVVAGESSKEIDVRDPKAAKRMIQDIQTLSAAEEAVFSYPLEDLGVISACIDVQKQKYILEPE